MLAEQQPQPPLLQPSALANRSFLYRSSGAIAELQPVPLLQASASEQSADAAAEDCRIVYATLDSLALRSATLQAKPTLQLSTRPLKQSSPAEPDVQKVELNAAGNRRGQYRFPGCNHSTSPSKPKTKKEREHERFAFAKNVLHYVPSQGRRYYRKSRNLASKSLSLRSLSGQQQQQQQQQPESTPRSKRNYRSLSRDELKYISISQPSNFVHVDSGSRYLGNSNEELPAQTVPLRASSCVEYAELDSSIFLLNSSIVWRQIHQLREAQQSQPQAADDQDNDDDDYDDVGPPQALEPLDPPAGPRLSTQPETQECKAAEIASAELVEELDEEHEVYDDVGPPLILQNQSDREEAEAREVDASDEDPLYDDVGPLRSPESTAHRESYEVPREVDRGQESAVDSCSQVADDEEDVYDDVGPAPSYLRKTGDQPQPQNHERVNSLYAGSLHIAYDGPQSDKLDSEWEDLDEPAAEPVASLPKKAESSSPSKKKGPRWSCKLRRQRSKASRKGSARSASRSSRSRGPLSTHRSPRTSPEHDSSDDSNYETLHTFETDDFSSSSSDEDEGENVEGTGPAATVAAAGPYPPQAQPPSRPIPAPPREESLGHSLGRRMKMLRRTWSITKGSLGRMRRRASEENGQPPAQQQLDPRKYFSFKKPFGQKSPQAGQRGQQQASSTFYLDKSYRDGEGSGPESGEPIYGNAHWYKQVGLYDQLPQQPPTDHYSVLTEEPLYQFYAANVVTRFAAESDSDGYEEVEELTPSSATTDLARPGHRTLWCQTPQVLGSGLLQKLSMEERRIQEAKFEIVTSEASYLNSLRVLENEFASNSELTNEILEAAEREKLFGGVPEVLVVSERFLAELEAIWREDPMLAKLSELLLQHARKCAHVYVDYCSNQVDVDATLKDLKAKKGYRYLEALSRIESQPACQSLSLHSFLMLPMQRITRLPLLADAVLSKLSSEHGERLGWERVLAELSQVVARCNEAARLAERRNEMDALARKLEYPAKLPPVELRGRELIRSGTVVQLSGKSDGEYKLTFGKKFHKTPLMLMLLTDYLLVSKLKSNSNEETFSVMETCKRSLVALEAAPEEGPLAGRHAMLLTLLENHAGRQVELVLSCESASARERWLDAVSPPKPSCLGETLYESWDCPQVMALYCYAAQQPDELGLQPGDVMNVLRKMNDGWLFGEKLLDGEQGWFPGNYTKEVASEHVRARNLRQRHRFLATSGTLLQRRAKQSLSLL